MNEKTNCTSRASDTTDPVLSLNDLLLLVYFCSLWSHYTCPKCSNDLKYSPCPPVHNLVSRVSGLNFVLSLSIVITLPTLYE